MISFTLTNNSVTFVVNNKVKTIQKNSQNWDLVLNAIRENDEDTLEELFIEFKVPTYTQGDVTIIDNKIQYKGVELDNYVVSKILDFMKNNIPHIPLMRFIDKLMKNPSRKSVTELYKFLEHKNMPITPDGNFLAYKGVRTDFYSVHTGNLTLLSGKTNSCGQIYNGIGEVIHANRNDICDNYNIGCGRGLHAGSEQYAKNYATEYNGKVIIVEIDPADVVSVPAENEHQKLRVCKYKVIGEYKITLNDNYDKSYSDEDWTTSTEQKTSNSLDDLYNSCNNSLENYLENTEYLNDIPTEEEISKAFANKKESEKSLDFLDKFYKNL